jgi:hypothetical protein
MKAKVFALNREELGVDAIMVEGTLSLHGRLVIALIDPESTQSYITEACACHTNWVGEELPYNLLVSTLLGKIVMAGCIIKVSRETL